MQTNQPAQQRRGEKPEVLCPSGAFSLPLSGESPVLPTVSSKSLSHFCFLSKEGRCNHVTGQDQRLLFHWLSKARMSQVLVPCAGVTDASATFTPCPLCFCPGAQAIWREHFSLPASLLVTKTHLSTQNVPTLRMDSSDYVLSLRRIPATSKASANLQSSFFLNGNIIIQKSTHFKTVLLGRTCLLGLTEHSCRLR